MNMARTIPYHSYGVTRSSLISLHQLASHSNYFSVNKKQMNSSQPVIPCQKGPKAFLLTMLTIQDFHRVLTDTFLHKKSSTKGKPMN